MAVEHAHPARRLRQLERSDQGSAQRHERPGEGEAQAPHSALASGASPTTKRPARVRPKTSGWYIISTVAAGWA